MISVDCETTGLDLRHGARPYLVTMCEEGGTPDMWEWDVDPLTREPLVPEGDLTDILGRITRADTLVLQNARFDITALWSLCRQPALVGEAQAVLRGREFGDWWPWDRTYDTLVAGHVLATNQDHDLTSMATHYLGVEILPFEERIKAVTVKARTVARNKFPDWRIAKKGLEEMPSARDSTWKIDMWLPKALARVLGLPPDDPWWTALEAYANADSLATVSLWPVMRRKLEARRLWKIFMERMKAPRLAYEMERRGVTLSAAKLKTVRAEYAAASAEASDKCVRIAATYETDCECNVERVEFSRPAAGEVKAASRGRKADLSGQTVLDFAGPCHLCEGTGKIPYQLKMPKSGNSQSLTRFAFEVMRLPIVRRSEETGNPSLDKYAIEEYLETLPPRSKQYAFVKALADKRKRDTAVSYMDGYSRFWLPVDGEDDYFRLHPQLNPTGTNTLRWSCRNPNEQNISKKEGFNLRFMFGPAPGREWYSLDAKNIELRLPAYESGEEAFIALFERPDDAPYFGSNHALVSHILFPREFEACLSCRSCKSEILNPGEKPRKGVRYCECPARDPMVDGRIFKKRYADTLYDRVKRGNFAVQYGAVDRPGGTGTADVAYGIPGAQSIIKARFAKQEALNQKWIRFAEKHGYVETMPDRTVDPERGYPIMCTRTEYGRILPTVPFNYRIQSTAMWWMHKAMSRCQAQLDRWRRETGFDAFMTMQVHDELVFDFPKSRVHPREDVGKLFRRSNLWRIKILQGLMESGGDDFGIPTPTSCEYHEDNWNEGVAL